MSKANEYSGLSEEAKRSKLIKKVIETTGCTFGVAEIALHDNEWDLNPAIMSIIERPNNVQDWMKKKGRKAKKQENKTVSGSNNQNAGNRAARIQGTSQGFRKDRPQFTLRKNEGRPNRETKGDDKNQWSLTYSFDFLKISKEDNAWKSGPLVFEASSIQRQEQNPFPQAAVSSFPQPVNLAKTYTDYHQKPLTFAAVAAAKNKSMQQLGQETSSVSPYSEQISNLDQSHLQQQQEIPSSTTKHPNDHLNKSLDRFSSPAAEFQHSYGTNISLNVAQKDSPTTSMASLSSGLANLNVNQEFTNKLKSDIGLLPVHASFLGVSSLEPLINPDLLLASMAIEKPSSYNGDIDYNPPITHNSSVVDDVEFVTGDLSVMTDFQFGFHASSPGVTLKQQPAVENVSSQMQQQKQLEQFAAEIKRQEQQAAVSKQREASLSFVTLGHVDYPNDSKLQTTQQQSLSVSSSGNKTPQQNFLSQQQSSQQQHLSQQQQHHLSLQQQQHQMYSAAPAAQYSNFPYPYLYSPAGNLRDVDQYTSVAPFSYNLNAMEMPVGAMIQPSALNSSGVNLQGVAQMNNQTQQQTPQQQQQNSSLSQHRSSNSESGVCTQVNTYQNYGQSNQPSIPRGPPIGMDNNFLNNSGNSGVGPPPGFSAPPFMTQPSFQSLFQMPPYTQTIPYSFMYPSNTPQQRQPQNHPSNMMSQQRPSEHNLYMDISKYPQQNNVTPPQNMAQPVNTYPGIVGLMNPAPPSHRQSNSGGTGVQDNVEYYQQQGSKWTWRGN